MEQEFKNRINRVLEICESTNDYLKALGEQGAPHGAWIAAKKQTQGRGRAGHRWSSLEGNLLLSVLLLGISTDRMTWLPLAIAAQIATDLRARFETLDLRVKWPNDFKLFPSGEKLGGILCESCGGAFRSFVVVGVGLNVRAAPEGLDQATTCLERELGALVEIAEIRELVIRSVLEGCARLNRNGTGFVEEFYQKHGFFSAGDPIEWMEGGVKRVGVFKGLGRYGELVAEMEHGKTTSIYSEDVTAFRRASDGFLS